MDAAFAVRVTLCPVSARFGETVNARVVPIEVTASVREAVLALKLVEPPYAAVMV
jgi:hypothetical protein